ncbi:hypothetical protein [Burkholderia sp. LA-2-3-30-S1-D2]|uniref:hypothetical protein n=1 Tax=Burkholderia sp. LA-2-3-30-S1-D2 TaxID=1637862 RepID=UPI0007595FA4|nr:hypothetical protein [Burkholderia sp. LA-2-3-30-S1-D2]AOI98720.1 hypothetical protein WS66_24270 [Burkholderia sp. LA-2-3-30-S1-D2]KVE21354.1 hypothetical protein WS66_24720 [Burkholderia sp. LA-2-3-30-S1-D2]
MEFETLFEGKPLPEAMERIGVMSVDSLDRLWVPVLEEDGYLIATSKDGKAALLGRMCKRDDGKFCIEVVARAAIENYELRHHEFWHVDPADGLHHARRLDDVLQGRAR